MPSPRKRSPSPASSPAQATPKKSRKSPKAKGKTQNKSRRRLLKELAEISLDNSCGNISAGLKEEDIYEWVATIQGPEGSPYEKGTFYLDISLSKEYPFKAPKVKFKTKIYHCNIAANGEICLNVLKDEWSPALTIQKVLLSICSLLTDANPDDPLVSSIAQEFIKDRKKHDKTAKEWTKKYAIESSH